jgi:hypothetical protein
MLPAALATEATPFPQQGNLQPDRTIHRRARFFKTLEHGEHSVSTHFQRNRVLGFNISGATNKSAIGGCGAGSVPHPSLPAESPHHYIPVLHRGPPFAPRVGRSIGTPGDLIVYISWGLRVLMVTSWPFLLNLLQRRDDTSSSGGPAIHGGQLGLPCLVDV